jgi:serine/threonine protein kinase
MIVNNLSELKTVDNPFIEDKGESGLLKEGDLIYDDCIRIIKFLSEGAQGRVYIGLIEEIDKFVAVKRILISYDENLVDKIQQECETVKSLEHPNIIKYFDIEIIFNTETVNLLFKICRHAQLI